MTAAKPELKFLVHFGPGAARFDEERDWIFPGDNFKEKSGNHVLSPLLGAASAWRVASGWEQQNATSL